MANTTRRLAEGCNAECRALVLADRLDRGGQLLTNGDGMNWPVSLEIGCRA